MANLVQWVKENPLSAALLGLVLTWVLKKSYTEYMPEDMEPKTMKAKSIKQKTILRKAPANAPGELTGEFKELLEEPPAM